MSTATDLYDVIGRRRDVRAEFNDDPLDPAALDRVLGAAHAAPSVGNSQPWDFVLVRDSDTRACFQKHVETERATYAATRVPKRSRLRWISIRRPCASVIAPRAARAR